MSRVSPAQLVVGANLTSANLSDWDWGVVNLDRAILRGGNLSFATFSEGYLLPSEVHTKHHVDDALRASSFRGADLSGANLAGAHLMGCDLSDADLSGAFLDGADLRRANLRNANLTSARLVGALLSGACLDGADATATNFRDADFQASRIPKTDSDDYFSSPKFVGIANLAPTSVIGLVVLKGCLDEAHTDGVDLAATRSLE